MANATVRTTDSAEATRAFGHELARTLAPGAVVLLSGDLGTGKTTLVQGICHALGVPQWANSPTFTLINEYEGAMNGKQLRIFHCDFYRIDDPDELHTFALDEVLYGDGIALVEWPEVASEWVPDSAVRITLTRTGAESRLITISGVVTN